MTGLLHTERTYDRALPIAADLHSVTHATLASDQYLPSKSWGPDPARALVPGRAPVLRRTAVPVDGSAVVREIACAAEHDRFIRFISGDKVA
jgi:hypothetical protein